MHTNYIPHDLSHTHTVLLWARLNMQSQLDIVEPAMRCSTYEKNCESTTFPRPSTLFIHQSSQLIHL